MLNVLLSSLLSSIRYFARSPFSLGRLRSNGLLLKISTIVIKLISDLCEFSLNIYGHTRYIPSKMMRVLVWGPEIGSITYMPPLWSLQTWLSYDDVTCDLWLSDVSWLDWLQHPCRFSHLSAQTGSSILLALQHLRQAFSLVLCADVLLLSLTL